MVLATQGRSFWILDDIAPLRQLTPEVAAAAAHLFEPSVAYRFGGSEGRGAVGQEPALRRALLLPAEGRAEGRRGGEARDPGREGSPRARRSRRRRRRRPRARRERRKARATTRPKPIPAKAGPQHLLLGPALPARLEVRGPHPVGRRDGWAPRGSGTLPGAPHRRAARPSRGPSRSARTRASPRPTRTSRSSSPCSTEIRDQLTATHDAIARLRAVRDQAKTAAERAKGTEAEKPIADAAEALAKKLTAVEEALYQTKNRSSQDPLNYPIRLNNKLAALASTVASADAAPDRAVVRRLPRARRPASTPSSRSSTGCWRRTSRPSTASCARRRSRRCACRSPEAYAPQGSSGSSAGDRPAAGPSSPSSSRRSRRRSFSRWRLARRCDVEPLELPGHELQGLDLPGAPSACARSRS